MNAQLLKAKMIENGFNQRELAKKIGISENSMSRKLTGKRVFTVQEAAKLCECLNLDDPEAIFFAPSSQISNVTRSTQYQKGMRNEQ